MKIIKIFLLGLLFAFIGCATVVERTDNTATISGRAGTFADAELAAIKEGRKLFGNVEKTRDSECTQEFQYMNGRASTYWVCIVYVKKS